MSCKIMGILEKKSDSKEEEEKDLENSLNSRKVHTDIQGSYSSPHRSHALGEGSLHRVILRTYGKTMFVIIWTFFSLLFSSISSVKTFRSSLEREREELKEFERVEECIRGWIDWIMDNLEYFRVELYD